METVESGAQEIEDISWNDMNKGKFFTLSATSLIGVRAILYPLTLIKTRLQTQSKVLSNPFVEDIFKQLGFFCTFVNLFFRQKTKKGQVYTGTFDACKKILSREGFLGLFLGDKQKKKN